MPDKELPTIWDYADTLHGGVTADRSSIEAMAQYFDTLHTAQQGLATDASDIDYSYPPAEYYNFGVDVKVFQGIADAQDEAAMLIQDLREQADEEGNEQLKEILDKSIREHLLQVNPMATDAEIERLLTLGELGGDNAVATLQSIMDHMYQQLERLEVIEETPAEEKEASVAQKELQDRISYLEQKEDLTRREKAELAAYKSVAPRYTEEAPKATGAEGVGFISSSDIEALAGLTAKPEAPTTAVQLEEGKIEESQLRLIRELTGDLRNRAGFLQNKILEYEAAVYSAIEAPLLQAGFNQRQIEKYYGRGREYFGYDRRDPQHQMEMEGAGTWGWRDLAHSELMRSGLAAVDEGQYEGVINLSNGTIRQFFDTALTYPELRGAISERTAFDIIDKTNFEGQMSTSNNFVAYLLDRLGNAWGSRLADSANLHGYDLLSIYKEGVTRADERLLQHFGGPSDLQKDLQIDAPPPQATWDEILFNVRHDVDDILKGKGAGGVGDQYAGLFRNIGGAGGQDFRREPLEEKEPEEPQRSPRRLVFPSWRYHRPEY